MNIQEYTDKIASLDSKLFSAFNKLAMNQKQWLATNITGEHLFNLLDYAVEKYTTKEWSEITDENELFDLLKKGLADSFGNQFPSPSIDVITYDYDPEIIQDYVTGETLNTNISNNNTMIIVAVVAIIGLMILSDD